MSSASLKFVASPSSSSVSAAVFRRSTSAAVRGTRSSSSSSSSSSTRSAAGTMTTTTTTSGGSSRCFRFLAPRRISAPPPPVVVSVVGPTTRRFASSLPSAPSSPGGLDPFRASRPPPRLPSSRRQSRSMFIQTESTPNPESIKFLPGRPVLDESNAEGGEVGGGFYATKADRDEIDRSPLAKRIFDVDGIKSVYLGSNFVTVTKYAETHWSHVRTSIFSAIMDHYASGKPALSSTAEVTDTTVFEDDDEVVAMIKELLESRIRPAVQEDGGDIRYVGYDPEIGVVTVRLAGSCVGCPSSSVTLKQGVENMMMHYIPEVTAVTALEEEEEDDDDDDGGGGGGGGGGGDDDGGGEGGKKLKTYEERLAAAGIPFSD